jgi:hypothetical protein
MTDIKCMLGFDVEVGRELPASKDPTLGYGHLLNIQGILITDRKLIHDSSCKGRSRVCAILQNE